MASTLFVLGQATENEFTTEDWLVPLITAMVGFAGAVLGVIAGQRLSRATQVKLQADRGEHEREVELEKDQRAQAAEQRSAERVAAGERRQVRAICRLLEGEFNDIKRVVESSARHREWWPEGYRVEIVLRHEDRRLLAANMSDHAWEVIALADHVLHGAGIVRTRELRERQGSPQTDYAFAKLVDGIEGALYVLTSEQESLREQGV